MLSLPRQADDEPFFFFFFFPSSEGLPRRQITPVYIQGKEDPVIDIPCQGDMESLQAGCVTAYEVLNWKYLRVHHHTRIIEMVCTLP